MSTAIAPTVTIVTPGVNATGVATNLLSVTATFSEPMAPITAANFTVACKAACATAPTGTVTLDVTNKIATFTVTNSPLLPLTTYTATVTGAKSLATGLAISPNPYVWDFTTGVTPDIIKPNVVLTVPANLAVAVPTSTAILAVFSEDMNPLTINSLSPTLFSFTLTCAPACITPSRTGNVNYVSRTATFSPGALVAGVFTPALLEAGKTYTATINGATAPAATDIAGNPLALVATPLVAANYVWTFTTAAAAPPPPAATVLPISTNPVNLGTICSTSSISVTFGVAMDPTTVNTGTFTVTGPGVTPVVAASVVLDPTSKIATFTPFSALTPGVTYTATIKNGVSGVKDLTGNTLGVAGLVPNPWTFTASLPTVNCPAPEPLGAASTFGFFSGLGITNQGDDPYSRITGNAGTTGAAVSITGLHDAVPVSYTETCGTQGAAVGCGLVTGTIFATSATSTAVAAAAQLAYNNLSPAVRLGGLNVMTNSQAVVGAPTSGELGGRTLAPGVYYSVAGTPTIATYAITAGDLTLDAGGNPNAVWIFQTAVGATGTLTVSTPTGPLLTTPRSVILINGAQAKNVFWYVGSAATINTGSNMVGNIMSGTTTTFGTADTRANPTLPGTNPLLLTGITTLEGRAVGLTAGVTMVNTHINVPAP